jgi:hypothetical protein
MSRSYSQRTPARTPKDCPAEFLIDFDGLDCREPYGHDGMHHTTGVSGHVWWKQERDE